MDSFCNVMLKGATQRSADTAVPWHLGPTPWLSAGIGRGTTYAASIHVKFQLIKVAPGLIQHTIFQTVTTPFVVKCKTPIKRLMYWCIWRRTVLLQVASGIASTTCMTVGAGGDGQPCTCDVAT
eukprot:1385557-Amphidinium_carterae.1